MADVLTIRHETPDEYETVENLVREAFWDVYRPGCDEHLLTHLLRPHAAYLPEHSFVAEFNGVLCGMIATSKARIVQADESVLETLTFGPLAVAPAYQKRGIGAALLRHAFNTLQNDGFTEVVIYGNPAYYGRFNFVPAQQYHLAAGDGSFCDALLIHHFGTARDCSGRFFEDDVFHIDPAAAEAFDAHFPPKVKHVLPTQLFQS